ncbi:acyltransferase family protein [Tardiphaga sp. 841_E9_N1_2]|uniref:acyltransferase family protein n=1 Tax=Tardiphaga sp. 841_E9_N1_2 TaxID=3240762 RepID=UPI003F20D9B3
MQSNAPAAPLNTNRNNQLDGLRGYAALVVVVFHTILGIDPTQISRILYESILKIDDTYGRATKIVLKLFNGETAVVIFFVLSGAVLFNSLRHNTERFAPMSLKFLVRRFLRIYPALFVCLVACAVVFPPVGIPVSFDRFLLNATLYEITINGATWTLNVEFIAAIFLLLAYAGFRLGGEWGLFAISLTLVVIFKAAWLKPYMMYFKQFWVCFALGALIPTRAGAWIARCLPSWGWLVALLIVIIFRSTLQHVAAAALVTALYYGKGGSFGVFLERPVSIFLGRISYSFYLFNVVFLEVICHYLRSQPWAVARPIEVGLATSLIIILLTIPVAWLSVKLIEEPSIRLGRRLTSTRPDRHAPPALTQPIESPERLVTPLHSVPDRSPQAS